MEHETIKVLVAVLVIPALAVAMATIVVVGVSLIFGGFKRNSPE